MAAPNIIPMADIMLVLLIIFMVVTPMLQKGLQVDMAKVDQPDRHAQCGPRRRRDRRHLAQRRHLPRQPQDPARSDSRRWCATASRTDWIRPCSSRATAAPSMATWSSSLTRSARPAWTTSDCSPTSIEIDSTAAAAGGLIRRIRGRPCGRAERSASDRAVCGTAPGLTRKRE